MTPILSTTEPSPVDRDTKYLFYKVVQHIQKGEIPEFVVIFSPPCLGEFD